MEDVKLVLSSHPHLRDQNTNEKEEKEEEKETRRRNSPSPGIMGDCHGDQSSEHPPHHSTREGQEVVVMEVDLNRENGSSLTHEVMKYKVGHLLCHTSQG